MAVNRREFLTAAVAAAATAPPVRAALLGTQHSHARDKLRVMQQSPDFEVAGVCEPDPEARQAQQKSSRYGGVRWLSEEELLGDAGIQLVVAECRTWEAIPWGWKVIRAGKHLHLEKPPGDRLAPFRQLVEEAQRRKLLLQMGYIWRFHQGLNAAIESARRGDLGEVFLVRGTINTDISAERRAELARYRGGMMLELGCHLIDRVVQWLGRPKQVRSWLRHDSSAGDKLADNTLAALEYDKTLAVISSAARQAGASQHRSFEILGTDGSILLQPLEPGAKLRVTTREGDKPGPRELSIVPPVPRYVGDLQALARAIQTGQPLQFSYDHELLLQETLERVCG